VTPNQGRDQGGLTLSGIQRANLLKRINMLKNELMRGSESTGYKRNLKSLSRSSLPVGSLAAVTVDHPSFSIVPSNVHNLNDIITPVAFQQSQRPSNRNKIIHPEVTNGPSATSDEQQPHAINNENNDSLNERQKSYSIVAATDNSSSIPSGDSSNSASRITTNKTIALTNNITSVNSSLPTSTETSNGSLAYQLEPMQSLQRVTNTTKSSISSAEPSNINSDVTKFPKHKLEPYSAESMSEVIDTQTPPLPEVHAKTLNESVPFNDSLVEMTSHNPSTISTSNSTQSTAKKTKVLHIAQSFSDPGIKSALPLVDSVKQLREIKEYYEDMKNGSFSLR